MIKLSNKRIILGVCGGIAAYKCAELCRLLTQAGATVQVVMTEHAKQFVTTMTFQALSGRPVRDSLFDAQAEQAMGHIELARWADGIIIAPATANMMAKLSQGIADDLLTTLCLASRAPKALAPAMNQQMWQASATQANAEKLGAQGYQIIGPGSGAQACGDVGVGRLVEPAEILSQLTAWGVNGMLAGRSVLITAGPTREALDPVRYISNRSSGKMAAALCEAALDAGAKVTVVSGPVNLSYPDRAHVTWVESAMQMYEQVNQQVEQSDIFIACAAVADYRCAQIAPQKIKKSAEQLTLSLVKNPDILAEVAQRSPRPLCIGFAAESQDCLVHAKQKLDSKQCDYIIANDIANQAIGFDQDDNAVTILSKTDHIELPIASKAQIAHQIIEIVAKRSLI